MNTTAKVLKQVSLLMAELLEEPGEASFQPEEVDVANRTSRSMGAVGAKAVVPRVVRDWIQPTDRVLDFGAGKDAAHAVRLQGEGYDVTAHEFGANQKEGLHDPQALTNGPYDVVYASNVLNVQSKPQMMERTLRQIRRALKVGGIFIANFPKQPRKMGDLTPDQLAAQIASVFGVPAMSIRPGGMPKAVDHMPAEPIFFVRYKGFKGTTVPEPTTPAKAPEPTMASKTQEAVKAAIVAIESAKKLTATQDMTYGVVFDNGSKTIKGLDDFVEFMKKEGFPQTGTQQSTSVRAELRGQPKFKGVLGPFWNGGAIRYESQKVYNENSASAKLTAHKMKAGHMQAQVFKGDVLVVETDDGTTYIPAGDAKKVMVLTRDRSPEEVNSAIADFLGMDEGSVSDVSIETGKWLARSSAPGYMDATDYSMFDSEEEAWSYLIDMDPSLFTWTVELTASDEEGGTAHIYMESDAAAKAMKDAVQSIDGSNLERDGDFVYVGLTGNGETVKDELDGMGFGTEEG